jgi:tetratricopeptide (TPR) repeat protein
MGEEKDPREAAHGLVPPPRVETVRTRERPAAAGAGWKAGAVIAALAILAVATFLLTPSPPDPAAPGSPAAQDTATGPAGPVPAGPGDLEERARRKGHAEALRDRAVRLREDLISRGVQEWDGRGFAAAEAALSGADAALGTGRYGEAEAAYDGAVAALEDLDAAALVRLQELLSRGRRDLEAGDAEGARAAFELAARIDPGSAAASTGLDRAEALGPLAELLRDGGRMEREGYLEGAARAYRDAAALDPMSRAAQEALARVEARRSEDAFARTMSEGLAALNEGEYAAARGAFERAGKMRPGSPQVAEALAQVDEAESLESIARHRARARLLEEREEWAGALAAYEAVLAISPNLSFARDGAQRCRNRVDLQDRLAFHLAHPERLADDEVYAEAAGLLEEARRTSPAGPRLTAQMEELASRLEAAGTRVPVRLVSDERTEVTVYRVGRLGTFEEVDLELRPGTYTVVGSRQGYRDVRLTLEVTSDPPPAPLVVRCEERL